jgi:hypothetical protein
MGMAVMPFKISLSTPGAILHPQPPPWDSEVSLGSFICRAVVAEVWLLVAVDMLIAFYIEIKKNG